MTSRILHHDRNAIRALTSRHAGNVTCGKNANRKDRTDDPALVTCKACMTRLARTA